MKLGWRYLGLLATVLLIGALVFVPDEENERDTIRVAIFKYLSYAPLFIALEEGFFAAEGLDVEFFPVTNTSTAIPSLVQGDIDVFAAVIMPAYFNIINRGGQIRVVAGKGIYSSKGCAYSGLVARRELIESGRISQASDLAGFRVTTDRTAPSYYRFERYLSSGGLTMDDVKLIDIPLAARFHAFENNALDIATTSEPWLTRMLRDGHSLLLVKTGDILPDFQFGFLFFGKNLLEDRREAGRKFILAYLQAVRHMITEGKTDRHIEILAKHTGLDKELLEDACWPSQRFDGRVQTHSLNEYQEWAYEQGLVDEITEMEALYDSSFIEDAILLLDEQPGPK